MEGKQKHIMKKISNVPTGVSVAFIQRSYADSQRSFSSIQFSHSVVSDSLWPHESQHTRPPCPSPTPGIYPNSRPLSWWCHPTISSSVVPFSSCLHSFPTSGSFQMSQLFASGGQSNGVSASTSILPMNTQGWFPLGWTGLISLLSKGLLREKSDYLQTKETTFSLLIQDPVEESFHYT